jgi:hypothetical protein
MLAFGIVQISFANMEAKQDGHFGLSEDEATLDLQDSRNSDDERFVDSHEDITNQKRARFPNRVHKCSWRIPVNTLKTILARRIRALKKLGVRVVKVSRKVQKALRKKGKVIIPSRRRSYGFNQLCQETKGHKMLVSANTDATLAYVTTGVQCVGHTCEYRSSASDLPTLPIGRCALKMASVVVPFYVSCKHQVPMTLTFGCACKCVP